jgi:hypothetical protein
VRWLLVVSIMLLTAGCSGASKQYQTAKVSGTVTIDKKPVEKGTINFLSEGTGPRGEDSADIVGGKFTAKQVPLGKVRIFIIATQETGKMIPGSGTDIPEVVSIVPPSYSQGLEATIPGNVSDHKIDLVSTP